MRRLGDLRAPVVVCSQTSLEARERVDPSQCNAVEYDDLVASPVETTRSLFERLGLLFTRKVEDYAAALRTTTGPSALSPPRPGKSRDQYQAEIERILPLVTPTQERGLGRGLELHLTRRCRSHPETGTQTGTQGLARGRDGLPMRGRR